MMKLIIKDAEPLEWKKYRETDGADFKASPTLRKALYDEQGGICAYCMGRLLDEHYDRHGLVSNADYIGNPKKPERVTNKIEHIKCRENKENEEFILDYNNLVMCCCGIAYSETDVKKSHCDTAKGKKDISFTPLDPVFIDTISYDSEGEIISSNEAYQNEFNTVLNLNDSMLKEYRSRVYKEIQKKVISKNWTTSRIRLFLTFLESRDRDNLFAPYCGVAISFVKNILISNGFKI